MEPLNCFYNIPTYVIVLLLQSVPTVSESSDVCINKVIESTDRFSVCLKSIRLSQKLVLIAISKCTTIQCLLRCKLHPSCKAISMNSKKKSCELYSARHDDAKSTSYEDVEWTYMTTDVEETKVGGRCTPDQLCYDDEKCTPTCKDPYYRCSCLPVPSTLHSPKCSHRTFRTCGLALGMSEREDGFFRIDPGSAVDIRPTPKGATNTSFVGLCRIISNSALTCIGHNLLKFRRATGYSRDSPGSFIVAYDAHPNSIAKVIQSSKRCWQEVYIQCRGIDLGSSFMKDKNGKKIQFAASTDACPLCDVFNVCKSEEIYTKEKAHITDTSRLPITEIVIGDTMGSWDTAIFKLGCLECIE